MKLRNRSARPRAIRPLRPAWAEGIGSRVLSVAAVSAIALKHKPLRRAREVRDATARRGR